MNLPLQMGAVLRGYEPSKRRETAALVIGNVLPAHGVPGFQKCAKGEHACMCPGNATSWACCKNGALGAPQQGEYCTCNDGKPGCQ